MKNVGNEFDGLFINENLWSEMRATACKAAASKLTNDYVNELEDIVQDVLCKVYENQEKFDGTKGQICGWVYRITVNACIDLMRNKTIKKISRMDDAIEYSLKDEDYIDREDVFLSIEQSINQLNELDKRLIILKYYEGKSSKEIAIILNVPEKYVPVFMQRARKKLGNYYQNFNIAA